MNSSARSPKPLASSKVYCDWPTLYGNPRKPRRIFEITVNVYRTLDDMRRRRNQWRSKGNRPIAFWCIPEWHLKVSKSGKLQRTPYIGEINLAASRCNSEIVAHECFHAVMALARRLQKNPACAASKDDRNREEMFARAFSQLFEGAHGLLVKARRKQCARR